MRRPGRLAAPLLLLLIALAAGFVRPLVAQGNRDSLTAGSAAYDRADFAAAARLLSVGLDPAAGPRDSLWINGVHKLVHSLLQTGDTAYLPLWVTWATRVAPNFPVDTLLFPPAVQHAIVAARARRPLAPADTLVTTTWRFGGNVPGRGALMLGRATGFSLGVMDSLGSILPGERRTLEPGVYAVTLNIDGAPPLRVVREVLPGVTTVITPRPQAVLAAAETPAERAAAAADTNAALDARIGAAGSTTCYATPWATYCWGGNGSGQLGGGWADSARGPVVVGTSQSFTAVTVGSGFACGLTGQGAVYCWGAGTLGQLGNGAMANSLTPVAVSGGQVFTAIAAGAQHTCGIVRSGAVWCWGAGTVGQLGNRAGVNSAVPISVSMPSGATFKDIAAGGNHSCAVNSRGVGYCWGSGSAGELGNGSTNNALTPVEISGFVFKAIAAGGSHTCGIRTNGQVVCWGAGGDGQLGNLSLTGSNRPMPIADTTSFALIAAGDAHTCALTPSDAVWCWGAGTSGQLGDGRTSSAARPRLVIGGLDIRGLAAGASHTCGVTSDRMVWCWGANDAGQVGSLAGRISPSPLPVVSRPAPHAPPLGMRPRREIHDDFNDGNLSAGVVWQTDSVAGDRIRVDSGQVVVGRGNARGAIAASDIVLPVHASAYGMALRFDVRVTSNGNPGGCGLNCTAWPALVRVRLRNRDFTESELWYAYGVAGRSGWSAGGITLVPRAAPAGQWLRRERLVILDAAPRADSILEVSFGGIGTDFEARFDNIAVPAVTIASVAIAPDSVLFEKADSAVQLVATPKDSSGAAQAWATVAWSSSDTAVAKVSPAGLVTAVANGTATIRAVAEEGSGTARVTVRIAPPRRAPARPAARPTRRPARRP